VAVIIEGMTWISSNLSENSENGGCHRSNRRASAKDCVHKDISEIS
jgi:hypothetical protein